MTILNNCVALTCYYHLNERGRALIVGYWVYNTVHFHQHSILHGEGERQVSAKARLCGLILTLISITAAQIDLKNIQGR